MALLNYSTTISALKTASEIENILIKHGVIALMKNADKGRITSLSFVINSPSGHLPIKLPINVEPVLEILKKQKRKTSNIKATFEQAERVAWRILKDWIEAQMAILETEMVKMEQIFLPYITAPNGQTLYEHLESKQFLLSEGK